MENRIGDARRAYQDRHGKFTQEDAAAFFGVSLSTYKKWEQGQGMMNGEQLREIAMKYDVTTDYLLGRNEYNYALVDLSETALSADEQELVDILRNVTQDGRKALMASARGIAATYPKNNQLSGNQTA